MRAPWLLLLLAPLLASAPGPAAEGGAAGPGGHATDGIDGTDGINDTDGADRALAALAFLAADEARRVALGTAVFAPAVEAAAECGVRDWPTATQPAWQRLDLSAEGEDAVRPLHAAAQALAASAAAEDGAGDEAQERMRAHLHAQARDVEAAVAASPTVLDDAFLLRAWRLLDLDPAPAAGMAARVLGAQAQDGGWPAWPGEGSESDTTGMVLVALAAADALPADAAGRAVAWLAGLQGADGGFPQSERPGAENVHSTAWALRGLAAAGVEAEPPARAARAWLLPRQNEDGGFPVVSGPSAAWPTADALAAVCG